MASVMLGANGSALEALCCALSHALGRCGSFIHLRSLAISWFGNVMMTDSRFHEMENIC